ncbi:hypothetical protein HPP92_013669 [Vanilla planifolia]|uniref:FBD domain-containing protein n=1 Tax=Vanilla planifolia TaxID=51239 RepID=A0A835QZH7_VANPL|nr:hypothetical protein HPP92_013669 [Vanilla planifolia]
MEGSDLSVPILNSFASLSISNVNIDFAEGNSAGDFTASLNQYLQSHGSNKITKFRISFAPLDAFAPDIENWIHSAVSRGVEDLFLDFSMGFDHNSEQYRTGMKPFKLPDSLFGCRTLICLTLSHSVFSPPAGFTGFENLKSLSLSYVNISEDMLQWTISSSPLLENLVIKNCGNLETLNVSSYSLQKLVLVAPYSNLYDIEITAPKLQSFIYYGEHIFGDAVFHPKNHFLDISSLTDAFISSMGLEFTEPEHDYIKLLSDLKQVKILTVCTATLLDVTTYGDHFDHENLPVVLGNLKELQLLVDNLNLSYIYGFFRYCPVPLLERLFIILPATFQVEEPASYGSTKVEEPSTVVFEHLQVIKVVNFEGCASEMRLLGFLLERAPVLESLVLVLPPRCREDKSELAIEQNNLYVQISLLSKASPAANVLLIHSTDDDESLKPTHTEYFSEFTGFPNA